MGSPIRHNLQPGFVLHHRAYRDTSLIVELFTESHGRVSVVARGVRKAKSRLAPLLQPFQPLLLSWVARGELGTLTGAESDGIPMMLNRRLLISGFYLNELIVRLLHRYDPHSELYRAYLDGLQQLASLQSAGLQKSIEEQIALRRFEKQLLHQLGYGLVLDYDVESGEPLHDDLLYHYYLDQGPVMLHKDPEVWGAAQKSLRRGSDMVKIHGSSLIDLARGFYRNSTSLRESKRLMRVALAAHLGSKPLHSRGLLNRLQSPVSTEILPQNSV